MVNISKPIIGILGVSLHDDEKNNEIALFSDYKNAVIKKDCIPFMFSPILNIDSFSFVKKHLLKKLTNISKCDII